MEDIVEAFFFSRNSASRETTTYVEANRCILLENTWACFGGVAALFRGGLLPLARRGFDALPSKKPSIDRP